MNFYDTRVEEYPVRPEHNIYGELRKAFDKNNFAEKVGNSYFLDSMENKNPVPLMRDCHILWLRLKIIIQIDERQIYQVTLEKPFISLKKNLIKSRDDLLFWFKKTNEESQDFIDINYKILKMDEPFIFSPPSAEAINNVVNQFLLENAP